MNDKLIKMGKEINNKILQLKREIKDLEKRKNKGSFKERIKISAKALSKSTKQVFGALGQAGNQVLGQQFDDVDDVIRRMPQ